MEYFIDIECNQFSEDIISIGIVNDNNEKFYSLVKPSSKITSFITGLTGITNSMVATAPKIFSVSTQILEWMNNSLSDDDIFYCYGNVDKSVYKRVLKHIKNSDTQLLFNHIVSHLVDDSIAIQEHFGLTRPVGLIKVFQFFNGEQIEQSHNALEDAEYLMSVHKSIQSNDRDISEAFPEYKGNNIRKYSKTVLYQYDKHTNEYKGSFDNIDKVVEWVYANVIPKNLKQPPKTSLMRKKISDAITNGTAYGGYFWKVNKEAENGNS